MRIFLLVLICMLCAACDTIPVTSHSAPSTSEFAETPGAVESLFPGDAATLSDGDIERILKYNYVSPEHARIAVLALGREFWFGYSDELDRTGKEMREKFISQLKSSQVVASAYYLPALLIPTKRSVAAFREAAVRYQADLLVIYQSSCRTYEKYRLFGPNKSKSYCNIEAVLLDVRTGLVPFSAAATEEVVVNQSNADMTPDETMRRAELRSLSGALNKVGTDISNHLMRR